MKAIAYIRVSTDRQDLSPEAQADKVKNYAAFNDYELPAESIVVDLATSGRTRFEEREHGKRALALLESADAIIFAKLSRAFRDAADALTLVRKLLKSGKDVLILDIGLSVRTPTGKMVMGMLAVQAEWEADIISERIREALAAAKKNPGWRCGPAPFGFKNRAKLVNGKKVDGGLHAVVDEEAAVVERIMKLRALEWTYKQIASTLREENVPTRRGGRWAPGTIMKIVRRSTC